MRNIKRLRIELSALRNRYGRSEVVFPSTFDWVKLVRFPLKAGMFSLASATILIKIPATYDLSSIRECFVDPDLKLRSSSGGYENLPHVHKGFGHSDDGYIWLCFEAPLGKNTGLLGFVDTLRAYFTNPHEYVLANGG